MFSNSKLEQEKFILLQLTVINRRRKGNKYVWLQLHLFTHFFAMVGSGSGYFIEGWIRDRLFSRRLNPGPVIFSKVGSGTGYFLVGRIRARPIRIQNPGVYLDQHLVNAFMPSLYWQIK